MIRWNAPCVLQSALQKDGGTHRQDSIKRPQMQGATLQNPKRPSGALPRAPAGGQGPPALPTKGDARPPCSPGEGRGLPYMKKGPRNARAAVAGCRARKGSGGPVGRLPRRGKATRTRPPKRAAGAAAPEGGAKRCPEGGATRRLAARYLRATPEKCGGVPPQRNAGRGRNTATIEAAGHIAPLHAPLRACAKRGPGDHRAGHIAPLHAPPRACAALGPGEHGEGRLSDGVPPVRGCRGRASSPCRGPGQRPGGPPGSGGGLHAVQ